MSQHQANYQLIRCDVGRGLPLADGLINSCVCSPPYYSLRRYDGVSPTDWPAIQFIPMPGLPPVTVPAMRCELGLETTPLEYTAHLVHVFRDLRRVLHPTGTLFLNLSDSYSGSGGYWPDAPSNRPDAARARGAPSVQVSGNRIKGTGDVAGIPPLNLLGIPWRVAFALQGDGWLLRSAPAWIKPGNAMPESCQSRFTTAHESLFLLAKTSDYYFDVDSIRRPVAASTVERDRYTRVVKGRTAETDPYSCHHDHETTAHPDGRQYRTSDLFLDSLDALIAWHRDRAAELERVRGRGGAAADDAGELAAVLVNPESFRGSHFATFPTKLVDILIRCSTPPPEAGCCSECGTPWRRVVELGEKVASGPNELVVKGRSSDRHVYDGDLADRPKDGYGDLPRRVRRHLGWRPACPCPPGTPAKCATILDCFSGSGTTGVVSLALGRDYVGIDASQHYLDMSRRRLERPHSRPLAPPRPADAEPLPLFQSGD